MNKIRGMYGDSFIERDVMGLRRDNILAMEKLYKHMQREANRLISEGIQ